MPEATPAPSAAPVAEPTSTPAPAPSAAPAANPPAAAPAAPAPVVDAKPAEAAPAAAKPAEAPAAPVALYQLPTDLKFKDDVVATFDAFVKSKTSVDGKFSVTAQDFVDTYTGMAREAMKQWEAQQQAQATEWDTETRKRFSPQQLVARDTGIGFLTSQDPTARAFADQYKNHPTFANVMRILGELVQEDTFERGSASPAPAGKSRAERMGYVKPKAN